MIFTQLVVNYLCVPPLKLVQLVSINTVSLCTCSFVVFFTDQPGGCGLHATFEAYPGYALYEYDDETLTDITEPECARRCMMMGDRCLSFDYNNCTKACALSSESK